MKYSAFIAQNHSLCCSLCSQFPTQGCEGWFFTCPAVFAASESLFPPAFNLGICGLNPADLQPFASPVVGIWDNEGTVIYLTIFNQNYSNLMVISPGSAQQSKDSPDTLFVQSLTARAVLEVSPLLLTSSGHAMC